LQLFLFSFFKKTRVVKEIFKKESSVIIAFFPIFFDIYLSFTKFLRFLKIRPQTKKKREVWQKKACS